MNDIAIQEAINRFKHTAQPSSGNGSTPATVEDINNLIKKTSELIITVVNAMKE